MHRLGSFEAEELAGAQHFVGVPVALVVVGGVEQQRHDAADDRVPHEVVGVVQVRQGEALGADGDGQGSRRAVLGELGFLHGGEELDVLAVAHGCAVPPELRRMGRVPPVVCSLVVVGAGAFGFLPLPVGSVWHDHVFHDLLFDAPGPPVHAERVGIVGSERLVDPALDRPRVVPVHDRLEDRVALVRLGHPT